LAGEGCAVAILDINEAAANAACGAIRKLGHQADALIADVSDYQAVKKAIGAFLDTGRTIDIVVNNAGWDRFAPFPESTPDMWRKTIDINLFGSLNTLHAALPGMIQRKSGRVVNIASDSGRVGAAGEVAYSASKGGIIALGKALARELAGKAISVNTVCPGPVDTKLLDAVIDSSQSPDRFRYALLRAIPMRRLGVPDEIAGIVAFLASDDASYITGQVISVSGGLTMSG
jgi:2-hydroxycyclohexanecarboxyl-CoA dehydrogenase